MQSINFLRFSLLLFALLIFSGCCLNKEISDPDRPTVRGWETTTNGISGSFILQKGETTDNGQIGIKLVEIYPAECQLYKVSQLPYAKILFYKVSDKSTICEGMFHVGGSRMDLPERCSDKLEWKVIYVQSIHYKEGWVAFHLRPSTISP